MKLTINKSRVDEVARTIMTSLNRTASEISDTATRSFKSAYDTLHAHSPQMAENIIKTSLAETKKLVNKSFGAMEYIVKRLSEPTKEIVKVAGAAIAPAVKSASDQLITALIALTIGRLTGKNHSITKDDIINPTPNHSIGGEEDMNDTKTKRKSEHTGKPSFGGTKQKQSQNPKKGDSGRQHHNDPKWYTNLDTHTEFRAAFGYPDIVSPFRDEGSRSKAVINTIKQVYIASSGAERIARTQQVYDMLKAVRGLSGNLPYSVTDLMQYLDVTYWAINEYYRLLAALRMTEYYSLQKSPLLPNSILDNIGFKDVITNKAQYIELLCTMHNFIRNSLPSVGTILNKIKGQWDSIIPDTNDIQFAVWYFYVTDHHAIIPGRKDEQEPTLLGPAISVTPGDGATVLDGANFATNTYEEAVTNWREFMTRVGLDEKFGAIRGDMLGAFGASVVINLDLDHRRDMFGKYSELALMKIHNTEFAFSRMITYSTSNGSFQATGKYNIQYKIDYTSSTPADISILHGLKAAAEGSDKLAFTKLPGVRAVAPTLVSEVGKIKLDPDTCLLDVHKVGFNEGETLEVLDGKFICESISMANENKMIAVHTSKYSDYLPLCMNSDNYTINIDADGRQQAVSTTTLLLSGVYHTFNTIATNEFASIREREELISQSDWAPLFRTAFHYSNDNVSSDQIKWDMNIIGTIDYNALLVAQRYIKYSIFAGDVSLGSKRFDNLVSVFNSMK